MGNPKASDGCRSWATEDEFGGFRVVIPVLPNWHLRLFATMWICSLAYGAVVLLYLLLTESKPLPGPGWAFMAFFLIGLTSLGGVGFLALAWNWAGREVIVIDDGWLKIRREVAGFSRSFSFEIAKIYDLRYSPMPYNPFSVSWRSLLYQWGIWGGTIAFAYERGPRSGRETGRFGDHLPEDEARRVIKTIQQRFKFPKEPDVEPLPIRH